MAVMEEPIEDGADSSDITEQFAPVLNRAVGCEQCAEAFVAAHDDLQQILGGGMRKLAHTEIVNDKQWDSGYRFHIFLASAFGNSVGQLVEQHMGFTIQYTVALEDDRLGYGLRQVALAGSAGTEKQSVFAFADKY